jgi:hypothetical protein
MRRPGPRPTDRGVRKETEAKDRRHLLAFAGCTYPGRVQPEKHPSRPCLLREIQRHASLIAGQTMPCDGPAAFHSVLVWKAKSHAPGHPCSLTQIKGTRPVSNMFRV